MGIELNDGTIFLHIPKTGGSWVEKSLVSLNLSRHFLGHKHADYERITYPHNYREALRWMTYTSIRKLRGDLTFPTTPRTFCFVRHPKGWYESWWKYNQRLNWPDWGEADNPNNWHPCAVLNGTGAADFNYFMENVLRQSPGFVTELYLRYISTGKPLIGKQESLQADFFKILQEFGHETGQMEHRVPNRINVSANPGGRPIEWDRDIYTETMRLEHLILKRCGYDAS